jgi:hypothetical protein
MTTTTTTAAAVPHVARVGVWNLTDGRQDMVASTTTKKQCDWSMLWVDTQRLAAIIIATFRARRLRRITRIRVPRTFGVPRYGWSGMLPLAWDSEATLAALLRQIYWINGGVATFEVTTDD